MDIYMELKLGRLIGNGATSEVYEYGRDIIIKLFSAGCSIESVRWEYNKTLCAYENHLPVPRVYEIIEHANRFGIVMEHVQGETLKIIIDKYILRAITEDIPLQLIAEQIFEYIKLTAHFLYDIHKITTSRIETMDDRMKRDVQENRFLKQAEKEKVIRIIEALPKGNSVCHGDPNPNNILVSGDRFIFIDWVNSGTGNPMYDIAEYILLSTPGTSRVPEDTHPKLIEFINKYKDSIVPVFLEEYEKLSGIDITGYQAWFVPLLVSKLNSNRTVEEKESILKNIRERLR